MIGVAEISAAIGGVKGTVDLLKGMNAAAAAVALNDAKIILQDAIFEAQAKLLAMQESQTTHLKRIDELEAEIASLKTWEREQQRYQLQEFPTGALAYVLKGDDPAGEPSHRVCPRCYQEGHKSILQTTSKHDGGENVECPRCDTKLKLSPFPKVRVDYGRRGSSWAS